MKLFRQLLFNCLMLLGLALTLSGCSSSSGGSNTSQVPDPLAPTGGTSTAVTDPSVSFAIKSSMAVVGPDTGTLTVTTTAAKSGVPIVNLAVTYSVISGSGITVGTTTPTTDKSGTSIAILNLTRSAASYNAIIQAQATYNGCIYIAYTELQVSGYDPTASSLSFSLTPSATTVSSDAGSLTVTAKASKLGAPIAGIPVTYSVISGSGITVGNTTPTTDKTGTSIAILNLTKSTTPYNAIIQAQATYNGNTYIAYTQIQVNAYNPSAPPSVSFSLTPSSTVVSSDAGSLTVTATASQSGTPLADITVRYSVISGTGITVGTTTPTTDKTGTSIAILNLTRSATAFNAIIQAQATYNGNTYIAYTQIQVNAYNSTTPPPVSFSLTPSSTAVSSDAGSLTVRATASQSGVPIADIPVTYSVIYGPGMMVFGTGAWTTDRSGTSIAILNLTRSATTFNAIIQAQATYNGNTYIAYTQIQVNAYNPADPPPVSFSLTPSSTVVSSDAGSLTVTATASQSGAPIAGIPVTYSIIYGPGVAVGTTTPTTDRSGTSIAILNLTRSATTFNAIIQAQATYSGNTYTAYTQIQVTAYNPPVVPPTTVNMTLTADRTVVDVNNGTVLLNAKLVTNSGSAIADQSVTFNATGPATITGPAQTDGNGNAKAILTTGNTLTTTNVIVEATTVFDGRTYRAYISIQLVRGSGVIMFTSSAGATPGSQINQLPDVAKTVVAGTVTTVTFLQQVSFKVTDSNGNPRVGVPVTLSLDNSTGSATSFIVTNSIVTTDSAGQGIFNVSVSMPSPLAAGYFTATSAIYKANTNDATPITAFIGGYYSLTAIP